MGEIVKFCSNRNVRTFRKKLNTSRPRLRAAPTDATPAIYHAVGAFKAAYQELVNKDIIRHTLRKDEFDDLRKEGYFLPAEAMDEIEALPEHTKAEIVLMMCQNIHDGWVYDYSDDFFGYFADFEFVYLPLELIGVKQLSYIFEPLEKALPKFGLLGLSFETVIRVYNEKRQEFVGKRQIASLSGLTRAILAIANEYSALKPELREALKGGALKVAQQVVRQAPELFYQAV